MALRSSHLKGLLFATSLLSISATAQNTTNSTGSDSCSQSANRAYEHPVNATGTANVSDLYVSVTFGDFRNRSDNFTPWTYAYLSAPEDSTDQVCVYMFEGIDNRRQGDGPNGCEGVLPQACVDLLERKLMLPNNLLELIDAPGSYGCPPGIGLHRDELNEACGSANISAGVLSTGATLNTTNMTCATPVAGVDLPEGYNTRELFGWSFLDYDTDAQNFTWYDQYVTRPIPMVIATVADGKAESKVVCIAPDDVLEGSRVPAESLNNGSDDESSAMGMEWSRKVGMAVLMAGVAAMSFVLA